MTYLGPRETREGNGVAVKPVRLQRVSESDERTAE